MLLSRNLFVVGVLVAVVQKLFHYDEEIEELYSWLEDCEEKISETKNHELKK